MPLTEFQKRKLRHMFTVLDVNRDGLLDRADYIRRVHALAELRGWTEAAPEYQRSMKFVLSEWENLRESADADEDGAVTRDEFLQYGEIFLSDREAVRAYARGDSQIIFDAMDTDGDGRVSLDEYATYLGACGVDPAGAEVFFRHADLNEDGWVTRVEMSHAVEEFFVSENPSAGGNFMYGPLGTS